MGNDDKPGLIYYIFVYGIGTLLSIVIPVGTIIVQAICDVFRKSVPTKPIVLTLFDEKGEATQKLIGLPHDLVARYLEDVYHVRIVTEKPKEPPPSDNQLLKWFRTRKDLRPSVRHDLQQHLINLVPDKFHRPKMDFNQFLSTLQDLRR